MKHFKIHDKIMYFGEEMIISGFSKVMNIISGEMETMIELGNHGNIDEVFMKHVQHDIKKI